MATTLLGQISEDVSSQYDPTFTFAESVTGPAGVFLAIFTQEYYQSDAGGFTVGSSSTPMLRCRDADALAKSDTVQVRTIDYAVVEVKPDGYGETILRLQRR